MKSNKIIYAENKKFHSIRSVANENNIKIPILSMHSTSKGY